MATSFSLSSTFWTTPSAPPCVAPAASREPSCPLSALTSTFGGCSPPCAPASCLDTWDPGLPPSGVTLPAVSDVSAAAFSCELATMPGCPSRASAAAAATAGASGASDASVISASPPAGMPPGVLPSLAAGPAERVPTVPSSPPPPSLFTLRLLPVPPSSTFTPVPCPPPSGVMADLPLSSVPSCLPASAPILSPPLPSVLPAAAD